MHPKASLDGAGCCKGNDEWALAARVALVHSVRHRQGFRLATLGYDAVQKNSTIACRLELYLDNAAAMSLLTKLGFEPATPDHDAIN